LSAGRSDRHRRACASSAIRTTSATASEGDSGIGRRRHASPGLGDSSRRSGGIRRWHSWFGSTNICRPPGGMVASRYLGVDHTLSDDVDAQIVGFDVLAKLQRSRLASRADRRVFAAWGSPQALAYEGDSGDLPTSYWHVRRHHDQDRSQPFTRRGWTSSRAPTCGASSGGSHGDSRQRSEWRAYRPSDSRRCSRRRRQLSSGFSRAAQSDGHLQHR